MPHRTSNSALLELPRVYTWSSPQPACGWPIVHVVDGWREGHHNNGGRTERRALRAPHLELHHPRVRCVDGVAEVLERRGGKVGR